MPWPPREWLLPPEEDGASSPVQAPYPWPPPEFLPQEQSAEVSFTPEEVAAYEQATPAWQPAGIIGAPIPDVTSDAGPPPLEMPAPILPGGYDIGLPLSEWAPPAPAAPAEPPQEVTFTPEEVAAYEQEQAPPKPAPVVGPPRPETPEDVVLRGLAMQEEAGRTKAATEAQIREEAGKAGEAAGLAYQEGMARAVQARDAAQQKTAAEMALVRREIDELASARIDPKRRFANASTAEKISWILSAAIGGYLAPYQGGKNPALEAMQKAIGEDINAQLADLDTRKVGIGARTTLLQQEIIDGKDAFETANKYHAAMLEASARQIEAMSKRLSSPAAQAQGVELAGQLRAQSGQFLLNIEQQKFANKKAEEKLAEDVRAAKATESLGWANLAERRREADAANEREINALKAAGKAAEAKQMEEQRKVLIRDVTGQPFGLAPDVTSAEKLRDGLVAYETFRSQITELRAMSKKEGRQFGGVPWLKWGQSDEFKAMTSTYKQALIQLKAAAKLGVMSAQDYALLQDIMGPGPQTWFGRDPVPFYNELLKQSEGAVNREMRIKVDRFKPDIDYSKIYEAKTFTPGGLPTYTAEEVQQMQEEAEQQRLGQAFEGVQPAKPSHPPGYGVLR